MAGSRGLPQNRGPFFKRRVLVVGRGPLGLFTALTLAQNGANVLLMGRDPLGEGVAFHNAAGLIEPVATEDPRAARWTRETIRFCDWAVGDAAWGMIARRVLFVSDDPLAVRGDWIDELGGSPADHADLRGVREHGTWFGTYVIQPDLALKALRRELAAFGIDRRWSAEKVGRDRSFEWVDDVARVAQSIGAEFFVLAPGLGLGRFGDVGELVGPAAGLSAGMGLTIELPPSSFAPRLEHVIMDFDQLGYLIPQKTRVIAGGTNHQLAHDDPVAREGGHPMLNDEWEAEVRDKIEALSPGAGKLEGEVKVGPRPMRNTVLTHWSEDHDVPGFILSGAGGSGWTFAVGIAHDVCLVARARLGGAGAVTALGTGHPLTDFGKSDSDAA